MFIQNIPDQRRSVLLNNRLLAETINRIKQEVAIELDLETEEVARHETVTFIPENSTSPELEVYEKYQLLYDGPNIKTKTSKTHILI